MITTWEEFLQIWGLGFGAGALTGGLCLMVRYIRLSYSRWFRMASNL